MPKPLHTVVITGASSGIGAAFAQEVAPLCEELVLVARRGELLEKLAGHLRTGHGVSVHVLPVDLSTPDGPERLWNDILEVSTGPLDLFVNNAGFGLGGNSLETPLEREKEMVSLNITALLVLSKLSAAHMSAKGRGHILNVASVAAFLPGPGMAVYYATKAFVLSYTEALDCELRSRGVRATALCPGSTKTPFHEVAQTTRVRWMQRLARSSPEDVARAALQGVLNKQVLVVPGLLNVIMVNLVRFLPRALVVRLSGLVLKE